MQSILLDQTPHGHAVEVRNLSKRYPNGTHAVKGVSFVVPAGETFGLLGAPGAGKSTILAMLSARILPTGGTARVAGFDVVKAAARVRSLIGVEIPADPVTAGSHRRGSRVDAPFDGACDADRVLRDRPVLLLRQRQRAGAQDCADYVNRLVRLRESRRLTIVVALHALDHVTTLCDQVALLDRGHLVALDSPWALLSGIEDVIVEFEPFRDAPAILQELHSHGMSIHNAFRSGHRIALPATRRQAHELIAIIGRERLSCSVVTTRRPTISDVRVQLLGQLKDVAAA